MIGGVVIGRNEAANLPLALDSLKPASGPVVYVDSASSDGSVAVAEAAEVPAVLLAVPPMLSAARARNAGLAWLEVEAPDLEFVVFLDGDCVLDPQFPDSAARVLQSQPDVGAVVGHLREHAPNRNIYARLSMLEWSSDVGDIHDFGNLGGIMCARVSAVKQVGGFDSTMIAGEDSELGVRLSLAGYRIVKVDADMAVHHNGIDSFSAWWRRSVRAGHALANRHALNGRSAVGDCRREFLSTVFWGLLLPVSMVLLIWPTRGLSLALLLGYAVLGFRMRRRLRRSRSNHDATAAALFGVLSKFANAQGLCRFFINSLTGRFEIMEYKRPSATGRKR